MENLIDGNSYVGTETTIVEIAIEIEITEEGKLSLLEFQLYLFYRKHFRNSNYDRRSDYRKHGTSNYDESDESDGGNSYSTEPNNKVIVRGLASHITEADVSLK